MRQLTSEVASSDSKIKIYLYWSNPEVWDWHFRRKKICGLHDINSPAIKFLITRGQKFYFLLYQIFHDTYRTRPSLKKNRYWYVSIKNISHKYVKGLLGSSDLWIFTRGLFPLSQHLVRFQAYNPFFNIRFFHCIFGVLPNSGDKVVYGHTPSSRGFISCLGPWPYRSKIRTIRINGIHFLDLLVDIFEESFRIMWHVFWWFWMEIFICI